MKAAFTILLVMLLAASASALEPEEILVIASGADTESVEIARYYCQKRAVPLENLIKLPLPNARADTISRKDYDLFIAAPIRQLLEKDEYAGKIKCLLNVYGVPFKIGPQASNPNQTGNLKQLSKLSESKTTQLCDIAKQTEMIPTAAGQNDNLNDYSKKPSRQLLRQLPETFDKTRSLLDKQPRSSKRTAQYNDLLSLYRKAYGSGKTTQYARNIESVSFEPTSFEIITQIENLQLLHRAAKENWTLDKKLESDYFTRLENFAGTAQCLEQLLAEIDKINGVETSASLDSELSMVMFDNYELYRWQPNELKQRILWVGTKTMMVSRLDGPDKEIAKALVDKAIAAEKKGLKGNAFFDSRFGPGNNSSSQYAEYDVSIQKAAEIVRQRTDIKVTEEQSSRLFQPGDCPDTALYCGWYSLKKYIDAFDFVEGAVGYHIASFEAINLRTPQSSQWCPAMLTDGITATIGPVAEPYLHAFPKPEQFFAELIKGKCLVEAYYKTKPFNSWQMLLVGDPLYKPFKTEY